MRRLLLSLSVAALLAGCATDTEPAFDTVYELYDAVGGEGWCDAELRVSMEPFVGSCGDAATGGRVVLGVGAGGEELRTSIDGARARVEADDVVLLVPTDPDREYGWQLRSRDRSLLEDAQSHLGGVILDTVADVDDWLG